MVAITPRAVGVEFDDEAVTHDVERGSHATLHTESAAEIDRRLASIANGSETFKPAAQAIADIRAKLGW